MSWPWQEAAAVRLGFQVGQIVVESSDGEIDHGLRAAIEKITQNQIRGLEGAPFDSADVGLLCFRGDGDREWDLEMLALRLTDIRDFLHGEGHVWLIIPTFSNLEHPEFRLVDPAARSAKWTRELTTAISPEWTAVRLRSALGTRAF